MDVLSFQGHPLAVLELGDRKAWIAAQVSEALGYDPKKVSSMIRGEWSEDFEEGVEFARLTGDELAAVKAAVPEIGTRAAAVTVLFEEGVTAVLQRTRQPAGVAFRRWWRREVMPRLIRGEPYRLPQGGQRALEAAGEPPKLTPAQEVALLRERRLAAREARLELEARAVRGKRDADDLRELVDRLFAEGQITTEVHQGYLVLAMESQLGVPLQELRAKSAEGYHYESPSRMASSWQVPVATVGRAISAVKVRGRPLRGYPDPSYCRKVVKDRLHNDGQAMAFEYTPKARALIRRALDGILGEADHAG